MEPNTEAVQDILVQYAEKIGATAETMATVIRNFVDGAQPEVAAELLKGYRNLPPDKILPQFHQDLQAYAEENSIRISLTPEKTDLNFETKAEFAQNLTALMHRGIRALIDTGSLNEVPGSGQLDYWFHQNRENLQVCFAPQTKSKLIEILRETKPLASSNPSAALAHCAALEALETEQAAQALEIPEDKRIQKEETVTFEPR